MYMSFNSAGSVDIWQEPINYPLGYSILDPEGGTEWKPKNKNVGGRSKTKVVAG